MIHSNYQKVINIVYRECSAKISKLFGISLSKNMIGTIISRFVSALGYMMLMPYLSIILIKYQAISVKEVAIVMGVFGFSQTGLMIPSALILDIIGHKNGMIFGRLLAGVMPLGFLYTNNFLFLLAISILVGLGSSLFNLACKSNISIETNNKSQRRLEFFALYSISFNAGSSIGPLLGSLFMGKTHFVYLLYIVAVLNIISIIIVDRFILHGSSKNINKNSMMNLLKSFYKILTNKDVYLFLIIMFFIQIIFSQFFSILPLYFSKLNKNLTLYSILLIINSVMGIIIQMPILRFCNLFIHNNNILGLGFGAIFITIGISLLSLTEITSVLFLATILFTIGEVFLIPFQDKIVSDMVEDPAYTHSYFSFFSVIWSLGKGFGNYIGIVFMNVFHGKSFWLIISTFGWIACLAVMVTFILRKRKSIVV